MCQLNNRNMWNRSKSNNKNKKTTLRMHKWRLLYSQPANIGPQDVLRMCPSNVPKPFPKDLIWPSLERPELTSQGRTNLRSWGHPNMTSEGRLLENVTESLSKKKLLGTMWGRLLGVPKSLFTFPSELVWLKKST